MIIVTIYTGLKLGGLLPKHSYRPWIDTIKRPKVYFDIFVGDENDLANPSTKVDRITFQLYGDIVPKTTENFIGLTGMLFTS